MLLGETGFVPGQDTRRTYTVAFDPSDLDASWQDSGGCPIFRAMRRAGVPVAWVGPREFLTQHGLVRFTPELQEISDRLSLTNLLPRRYARLLMWGREFKVTV